MTRCDRSLGPEVDLYFYEELASAERAAFETHLAGCRDCRDAVDDLAAIRQALDPRVITAPAGGDWRPFMTRLAARLDRLAPPRRAFATTVAILAMAATLIIGVLAGAIWERRRSAPAPGAAGGTAAIVDGRDVALASSSSQHVDRSLVVLLGLLNKEADAPVVDDWKDEQKLAASLLPDTRLYRLAAEERGLTHLADTLDDLELVLLQASVGDGHDRETLMRLQRLIRKRDLLMKIETLDDAGRPAGPALRRVGRGA